MKKVLFVASECVPFIKTGGLADVVGSLPKYFDKSKYDVRVMIPKYTAIKTRCIISRIFIWNLHGVSSMSVCLKWN